jgi:raffinose/stachyose/melibiose transport system permease protein
MLWRIVVPITRPTLFVLFTLFFIWTWNEFFIPLVMLIDDSTQTVPLAIVSLVGQHMSDPTMMNAGALLSLIPNILFFLFFQRTLTRGVTSGAVK